MRGTLQKRPRLLLRFMVAASLLGMGLAGAIGPAQADKVGVAAAVNPDAFSSLNGSPQSQLNIGKSIFFNERINTTGSGLVQVLLVDGSTFTVGPGSDLVIDKFVYDPNKQTGKIVASFSKGAMRFIGGKISKNEDSVKVNTPSGALAIRGGMFQGKVGGGSTIFSFLFGKEMIFTGKSGKVFTVYQPGYTLDLSGGVPKIRPTTAADVRLIMAALSKGGSVWTGNGGNNKPGPNTIRLAFNPHEIINTFTQSQIQTTLNDEFNARLDNLPPLPPPPPPQQVDNGENPPPPPPPPPPPVDTRVGGSFTGYASGFLLNGGAPKIVGNLSPSDVTLVLTPSSNTVAAGITVREIDPSNFLSLLANVFNVTATQYQLGYSGTDPANYPSDTSFAADANPQATVTQWFLFFKTTTTASVVGSIATGSPSLEKLCDSCEFIKWGSWGATLTSQQSQQVAAMSGWWVAGDITRQVDLPQEGNATYAGKAIGYEYSRETKYGPWSGPATATGDLSMQWNFGTRKGDLSITDFGAGQRNFSGQMCGGGRGCLKGDNHFAGALIGVGGGLSSGIKGAAAGSFVNDGAGNPAAGVIGNFGVGGTKYQATGIFGGSRVPNSLSVVGNGLSAGPH